MSRSKATQPAMIAAFFLLAVWVNHSVAADYQSTPAARGADAAMHVPEIELDKLDLRESFSPETLASNPALSDADVMAELHTRLVTDDRLEDAAANLAPEAPADAAEDTQAETNENSELAAGADVTDESGDEVATSVASR